MNDPRDLILRLVGESIRIKAEFFQNNADQISQTADLIAAAFRQGRKMLLFGNGGSAADAQHIAAEFVGRFVPERTPLPALSLATDGSVVTALGNDYGYEMVFARQLQALGNAGDVAVAISTSGNSPNVLAALKAARAKQMLTIAFTGEDGGKLMGQAEVLLRVPSKETPRIQETHIALGHILCELVDRQLFPEAYAHD